VRNLYSIILVAAVVGLGLVLGHAATRVAQAQDPTANGHKVVNGSQSITTSTSLVTARDSATPVVIKSMVITSSVGGVVSFGSGPIPATRAGCLLNINVPANTPVELTPELLGDTFGATGISTAPGVNLHAIGPGTLTYVIRFGPI
jgi:hypothetical protein